MHTIGYRDMQGKVIEEKLFDSLEDRNKYYEQSSNNFKYGYNLSLNGLTYKARYFRKVGNKYIIGVTNGNK